ncbi:hypothetical protein HAZT_HAZT001971 [Hyalella azteca]|uniref:UNC93-like protein n=1 Tax=Hyalella azteca TaxID=294128 RepID=A0A6A0HC04_HYAAZ|nr:hypothetical protein HAZT_HAZT001971 [Hyalella azteca]
MHLHANEKIVTSHAEFTLSPSNADADAQESRRIFRDVCCVAAGFFLLFTSYQSMANLQSSINKEYGTIAQSIIYATLLLSSLFLPTLVISQLGARNTIAVSMLGYSLYTAAQFYPTAYTLIPSAAILGLAASPLWSAKCTYLNLAAQRYAKLTGQNREVVVTRFFGIFFAFFQSTQVVGNLISSLVLTQDSVWVNSTDPALLRCGATFCHEESASNASLIKDISDTQRYTMSGIYLAFALAASAFIMAFVTPLSRHCDDAVVRSSTGRSPTQQLLATLRHLRNPQQILIIPFTFWSGLMQAFLSAEFTAAYVSCGLGVYMVGYTMICFGVFDALFSYCCSPMVKRVGRVPIFCFASLLHSCLIAVLFLWVPNPEQMYVFFVIPALWGICDAVWQTQMNGEFLVYFIVK